MSSRHAGINHRQNRRANPKEAGFTLIEVLFAVVFLSIGLLGIAAMQDIAISRNVDGRRLTVATNLAAEMLERVRYNALANAKPLLAPPVSAANPYLYHNIIACTPASFTPPAAACPLPPPCPASFGGVCTGPTAGNATAIVAGGPTAVGDWNQWTAGLAARDSNNVPLLPNAIGTVQAVALSGTGPGSLEQVAITVQVQWTAGLRNPTITMNSVVAPL